MNAHHRRISRRKMRQTSNVLNSLRVNYCRRIHRRRRNLSSTLRRSVAVVVVVAASVASPATPVAAVGRILFSPERKHEKMRRNVM